MQTSSDAARLPRGEAFWHTCQRCVVALCAPLWVPAAAAVLRFVSGYRIRDLRRVRAEFDRILDEASAPMLICANHLTLIDSLLIAWALRSPWRYLLHPASFPWNTPEVKNFAATPRQRVLAYLAKCIPIERGGGGEETARVLRRVAFLLSAGETALLFPEGGRSRSGRVEPAEGGWGVGRILASLPRCRVLCVYLRGDSQHGWSDLPAPGERFEVRMACIEAKSDLRGVRRSRDLSQQVLRQLAQLEAGYFDDRQ